MRQSEPVLGLRLLMLFPDFPVFALEIQERRPRAHNHILHLRNKDRVVSRILHSVQSTLKISEGIVQDWRTVLRAVKASPRLSLSMTVSRVWVGIILRNRILMFG